MPVSVAIVNDYEVVVRGVAALLEPEDDIHVVELEARGPITADIDVALFDTFGTSRIEDRLLRDVIDHPLVSHVVAYTSRVDPALIDFFLDAGGHGFVTKAASGPELADVIRRVHAGEIVVHSGTDPVGIGEMAGRWPGQAFGLTEVEADTLALVADGLENEAIANELYVSVNTVKARLKSIYRKIEVDNRVRAALWAAEHGFESDRHREWGT